MRLILVLLTLVGLMTSQANFAGAGDNHHACDETPMTSHCELNGCCHFFAEGLAPVEIMSPLQQETTQPIPAHVLVSEECVTRFFQPPRA